MLRAGVIGTLPCAAGSVSVCGTPGGNQRHYQGVRLCAARAAIQSVAAAENGAENGTPI